MWVAMRLTLAHALAAILPACAEPAVGPSVPGGGQAALEPTMTSISQNILTPRCLGSACHSEGGGSRLNLTEGQAWASLYQVPAEQPTLPLDQVEPGDPGSSYLMLKLLGTQASVGGCCQIMPPEGSLEAAELQVISDWIFSGANDD
jgi:hypothetical protein